MFINEVLEIAEETGGLVRTDGVKEDALETAVHQMHELGLVVPQEYQDFLKQTDGIYWGGLEFFGATVTKKDEGTITDFVMQNKFFQELGGEEGVVFLGRSDEENFIYRMKEKKYLIIDEFSKEVAKDFLLFEQMFEYLMTEQNELIQNCVTFAPEEEEPETEDKTGIVDLKFFK